jgi:hypothetical protein
MESPEICVFGICPDSGSDIDHFKRFLMEWQHGEIIRRVPSQLPGHRDFIGFGHGLVFILSILIAVFPFIESIYRFDKDLSGKQSMLEQMIPVISWKKVLSKLISTLCCTVIGLLLGTMSIILFILLSSHFDKGITGGILNFMKDHFLSPAQLVLDAFYLLFCFFSMNLIFFFCIAISKSISYKKKIAVPIWILTFVLLIAAVAFLGTLLQRVPIIEFTVLGTGDSLSSMILSMVVFVGTLSVTSWLMENKVDH